MLSSLPRRPALNFRIRSANSGWSCSWIRGTRAIGCLLHLESCRLHDRGPALELRGDELPRRVRTRIEDRPSAGRHPELLQFLIRHDLARGVEDLLDDRMQHPGRSE